MHFKMFLFQISWTKLITIFPRHLATAKCLTNIKKVPSGLQASWCHRQTDCKGFVIWGYVIKTRIDLRDRSVWKYLKGNSICSRFQDNWIKCIIVNYGTCEYGILWIIKYFCNLLISTVAGAFWQQHSMLFNLNPPQASCRQLSSK